MTTQRKNKTGVLQNRLPSWALPVAAVVLVLVLGFAAWKMFTAGSAPEGAKTRPNIYD